MNIEPLEARIAPAILFTYTELDGDLVTVSISKGSLGDATFTHPPVPGLFGDQLQTNETRRSQDEPRQRDQVWDVHLVRGATRARRS